MTDQLVTFRPSRVRYIKLGEGGRWEQECLEAGIIRFGSIGASPERFPLCRAGEWTRLRQSFIDEGRDEGTATRFTNETGIFFEDDGDILWITFVGERLCWGQLTSAPPEPHHDGAGVWRSVSGGWKRTDVHGEPLTRDRASDALTKLVFFRGTSCDVGVADYTVRCINGE